MSSMQGLAGAPMSRPKAPSGYPDPTDSGWVRTEDLEIAGHHIRLTVSPGEKTVGVWELVDGAPGRWFGNVIRMDSNSPSSYLNFEFEKHLRRSDRDSLISRATKFWKS